jgi:hypothetical protein
MVSRTLWSVAATSALGFSKQRTVGGCRPPLFVAGRLSLRESVLDAVFFRGEKDDQNGRQNQTPSRKPA